MSAIAGANVFAGGAVLLFSPSANLLPVLTVFTLLPTGDQATPLACGAFLPANGEAPLCLRDAIGGWSCVKKWA